MQNGRSVCTIKGISASEGPTPEALVERVFEEGGVTVRRSESPTERRFYRLLWLDDLFGGFDLVSEWGRVGLGTRPRRRTEYHADLLTLRLALLKAAKRRLRRGYRQLACADASRMLR